MTSTNNNTKGKEMRMDDSFRITHDVYGKAVYAEVSDETIVNYFYYNNHIITSTYDRRSTKTTETSEFYNW